MKIVWMSLACIVLAACTPVAAALESQPIVNETVEPMIETATLPEPEINRVTATTEYQPIPGEVLPSSTPERFQSDLPDLGPAPELENEIWLNSDQPLRLANLGGKVVLLDMWTFG